jgi:molybdopterin synthase catalytic subunit
VTEEPLSLEAAVAEVADERAGGIATFTGTVRRQSRGREVNASRVRGLRRDGGGRHGAARRRAARTATSSAGRDPPPVGRLEDRRGERRDRRLGTAPAAALDACQDAIDTLKETVPLWKKEVYEGGEEWIGKGS